MRLTPRKLGRRGATMVEAALVLPVFLFIILGMIDLAVAVSRAHLLSEAARQGARQAIVHGAMAPGAMGKWGPGQYGPLAATDSHAIAQSVRSFLPTIDPAQVTITVEWPDGNHLEDQRVRVTVAHSYQPITGLVFNAALPLSASSTMRIAH